MLVADEVHRLGAIGARSLLSIESSWRLGLSATPERAGDPIGTEAILTYFGGIIKPEFTLKDAVAAGRLAPYEYHTHTVHLTPEEEREWQTVSQKIRKMMAQASPDNPSFSDLDPHLKHLLIIRSRIARKASAKVSAGSEVVLNHFQTGESWLVYCDDSSQLFAVREYLRARGLASLEYRSEMASDRGATLNRYERLGGVLVAIKCLDEGVDIPSISHAVILASSRNPREFIQRRGRVLRLHADKTFAVIHDLLVEPPDPTDTDFGSLVKGELGRAWEFADGAMNPSARLDLQRLAISWDIDPWAESDFGIEEEEEDSEISGVEESE